MRPVLIVLFAVLVAAGCSSSKKAPASSPPPSTSATSSSSTFDLSGTLTLYGSISTGVDAMMPGAPCIGIINPDLPTEDYEDVAEGTPLTVRDGTGATVGVGTLSAGVMDPVNPLDARQCQFSYSVSGILGGHHFYSLLIGRHETQQYPEDQFRSLPGLSLKSATYTG